MSLLQAIPRKSLSRTVEKCRHHRLPALLQSNRYDSERHLSTRTSDSPLHMIQEAIASLDAFSSDLVELTKLVDKKHILIDDRGLIEKQAVTLPEIVLHSRDTDPEEFEKGAAVRNLVMATALATEKELRSLAASYTTLVQQMETATRICQETPCGGASWNLNLEALQNNPARQVSEATGNQHVSLNGMDSPCGQLQSASMNFLKTAFDTKPQVTMGSRALLILQLAMDFNRPLRYIREQGTKEQNQRIRQTFESQVVPTPWVRTDEEYQHLLQIEEELVGGKK